MSDTTPPPPAPGEGTTPPPAPASPAPPVPPTVQQPYAPPAPVPAKPMGTVVPIIAAVLAGLSLITAIIPGLSYSTWAFAIPAIILAIIALVRKAPLKGLSLASVIVAPLAWLIAIIVSLVFAAASFNAGFQAAQNDDDGSTPSEQVQETSEPEEPAAETISGGDHIVGPDFAAGVYRAEVEESIIALCSVSQEADGNITDIRSSSEGSVIFSVQDLPGSVVSFSGCENIALAADVVRPTPNPVTNGDWLVGTELPAGQYKGTVDTASIIELGSVTQSNGKDLIDIATGTEGDVVFTVQDIAGSVVSFSGLVNIEKVG